MPPKKPATPKGKASLSQVSTATAGTTPSASSVAPEQQREKKTGGWRSLFTSIINTTNIAVLLVLIYIGFASLNMHRIMYPLAYLPPPDERTLTLDPLWPEGRTFDVFCYISDSSEEADVNRQEPVWRASNLSFGWDNHSPGWTQNKGLAEIHLQLLSLSSPNTTSSASSSSSKDDPVLIPLILPENTFWSRIRRGKDVYLHVYVTQAGEGALLKRRKTKSEEEGEEEGEMIEKVLLIGHDNLGPLHGVVPLLKRQAYVPKPPKRRLLSGEVVVEPEILKEGDQGLYWKPEVAVRLVTDLSQYPLDYLPPQIVDHLDVIPFRSPPTRGGKGGPPVYKYLPPIHVDEIGLTSDKYIGLNASLHSVPLTISYSPMSLQRWQLMTVGSPMSLQRWQVMTPQVLTMMASDDGRPMSLQRWHLKTVLEASLSRQKGLGLQESDIDDVRRLITDTNVYLLAITILASVLHLLFEFLAFQSDIAFWRRNKSLRGLSVRSVAIELVCQTIILAYLIDADSSLLVTVPSGFGVLVQVWKVQRATGAKIVMGENGWPTIIWTRLIKEKDEGKGGMMMMKVEVKNSSDTSSGSSQEVATESSSKEDSSWSTGTTITTTSGRKRRKAAGSNGTSSSASSSSEPDKQEPQLAKEAKQEGGGGGGGVSDRETLDLDRIAINHLILVLSPLALGFAARSLLMEEHASWYSWALSTLTSWVYTFGFILMTPQLYINYSLKSVSHLPWRFLGFRFVNTFIDDLFAFIIKMPTMHRISCFRDDVVFIIYLYQRWIYPVDSSRSMDAEDCGGT